jgi:NitT/TauT family transport system permease protein
MLTNPRTPLLVDVGSTLMRLSWGFAIGSLIGIALGMLMVTSTAINYILTPYVFFLRFIPPLAWLGLALLWFGTGEMMKIILVVYGTLFIVLINTMAGALSVPQNQKRMARSFGANSLQVFWMIVVPSTIAYALTGMRLAMGYAFMTVVTAEMIGAEKGLGYILHTGRIYFQIPSIFVAIVLLGLLGLLIDRIFLFIINKLAWKYQPGHR